MSMEGYLRGYYGYRNFGDELLFFGVVKELCSRYSLSKLFVESGDVSRMEDRVRANYEGILTEKELKILRFVEANHYRIKRITHLVNALGLGKYRDTFKFFGGGEVISDERTFPHDGRNIPLLFNASVRKGRFALLGGIGKIRRPWTARLYSYLLPKAEKIIVRDKDSYTIATQVQGKRDEVKGRVNNELDHNVFLHEDFAQRIILDARDKDKGTSDKTKGTRTQEQDQRDKGQDYSDFPFRHLPGTLNLSTSTLFHGEKYILININRQSADRENIKKITAFCEQYPDHKKIFFPCDMNDDIHCFAPLKKYIPDLELYDRTTHSLSESLSLFSHADGGVGARLHFLLPLKLYGKPMVAIPYADKINRLIIKGTRTQE